MQRLYFALTCVTIFALTLLSVFAIALGTTQPLNPVLADIGYCSGAPCYMDIDLQTYDLNAADATLIAAGYRGNLGSLYYGALANHCNVGLSPDVYGDEVIAAMRLMQCYDLRVGELIELFGTPDHVLMSDFCDWVFEYSRRTFVHIDGQDLLLPSNRVVRIDFVRESAHLPVSSTWYGFTSFWRYRQYEPEVSFGSLCD